jgi:hypothetical protein
MKNNKRSELTVHAWPHSHLRKFKWLPCPGRVCRLTACDTLLKGIMSLDCFKQYRTNKTELMRMQRVIKCPLLKNPRVQHSSLLPNVEKNTMFCCLIELDYLYYLVKWKLCCKGSTMYRAETGLETSGGNVRAEVMLSSAILKHTSVMEAAIYFTQSWQSSCTAVFSSRNPNTWISIFDTPWDQDSRKQVCKVAVGYQQWAISLYTSVKWFTSDFGAGT